MSNQNNVCNSTAYLNSIDQRRRFQLYNVPPVRYNNLANNPYDINPATNKPFFTKYDLDMRRKVEILKYNANNSNTQTNSFTKAEIYAQAVSGKYQQRTYSRSFIQDNSFNDGLNVNTCPPGTVIKTPSTSCDVPGPVVYFYEDDTVPLYKYNTNIDSNYGFLQQDLQLTGLLWDYTRLSNIELPYASDTYSTITSIFIKYSDIPSDKFSIETPIALHITGSLLSSISSYTDTNALRINIKSVSILVKYSYSNVSLVNEPNYMFEHGSNGIPIDIGVNITNSPLFFEATCYLGILKINNIPLFTQKGYIYDIQTMVDYQILYPSNQYPDKCSTPILTTYLNIPSNFNFYNTPNCTITGASSVPPQIPAIFVSSSN
jgi:hypothetical protein